MQSNHTQTGGRYEDLAAAFLEQSGCRIRSRNWRGRHGELDLVAVSADCLIFCEVKYRAGFSFGRPEEAVDARKRRHLWLTAREYLAAFGFAEDTPCRFDVIAVEGPAGQERIHWLRDAFGGI